MPLSGVSALAASSIATPLLVAASLGALSMPSARWTRLQRLVRSDLRPLDVAGCRPAHVRGTIALLIDPTDMGDGLAQILHLPLPSVLAALAGAHDSLMAADWKALEQARRPGMMTISRISSLPAWLVLAAGLRAASLRELAYGAQGFGAQGRRVARRRARRAVLMVVAIVLPAIALAASIWANTFAGGPMAT